MKTTQKIKVPVLGFRYRNISVADAEKKMREEIKLVKEPSNKHDSFAVKVCSKGIHLGYISGKESHRVTNLINKTKGKYACKIIDSSETSIFIEISFIVERDVQNIEAKVTSNAGIYAICPKIGEKEYYYIGQSGNIKKRIDQHLLELSKGNHANTKLQSVYNEREKLKIEVLKEIKGIDGVDIQVKLYRSEQDFISLYTDKYQDKCLNISRGELIKTDEFKNILLQITKKIKKKINSEIRVIESDRKLLREKIRRVAKEERVGASIVDIYLRMNEKEFGFSQCKRTIKGLRGISSNEFEKYESDLEKVRKIKKRDKRPIEIASYLITQSKNHNWKDFVLGREIKESLIRDLFIKYGMIEEYAVINSVSGAVFSHDNRAKCFR